MLFTLHYSFLDLRPSLMHCLNSICISPTAAIHTYLIGEMILSTKPAYFVLYLVQGNWGSWSDWSKCSAMCGPGVRTRDRRCNNPYPNYGGSSCVGKGHESTVCSMPDCAIDGNWGAWSEWSDCQSDCGVATRHRTRACIDPPPAHGGRGCEGDAEEYHDCKLDHCPSEYFTRQKLYYTALKQPCFSWSCLALSYLILPCLASPCPNLPYSILFYFFSRRCVFRLERVERL